ncbi:MULTISPECIES: cell division protein FtsL [Idiomarina]|jgi:cell division protein FtsL|uniref:Cell division protein FtsL n=1 Tax=Idiomarina zobellii TaxID=86103 RepID=A0A837NE05_9GAMM|nr:MULTISPECIES: cell division protein FtsL [Idiomarina]MBF39395.1 cell division protein FtsL [Idiomarinaceae bacterium]KPD24203.1 cell division protein FtsL [Idiomarina zobellii]MCJ8316678.1 cell division protein FtsL [Idiomarina sp.]NQZ16440.1 cell division protein FtsL [Idiomarina sp.]SDF62489.1 cell division protein FtsL [Idiomarina zobellii]|tara:strand:+ start:71174 stop:71488 length:315 start_codon:yes stop_codon:yes gene_type:complete
MTKQRYPSLTKMVLQDLVQHKWVVLLGVVVVFNALSIVYVAHLNRQLTAERDDLLSYRDTLDREWRHLVIEQNALTEHSRVERIAQQQLGMRDVTSETEVMVSW